MDKLNRLVSKLSKIGDSYLMFSGGLDSCAILGAASIAGIKITPVWINNGFGRADEADIKLQANNMGDFELKVIALNPVEEVVNNPNNRCYFCKSQIVSSIKQFEQNVVIMDGTTGSDNGYRPGRAALKEYRVISPLAELGISSAEAKVMALKMGADKSISELESCLATRLNYGLPLHPEQIKTVREMERFIINKTNDYNVRCRLDDSDHIRIELSAADSFLALGDNKFRDSLLALGEKMALFTTIDLKPSRPNAYDNRIEQ